MPSFWSETESILKAMVPNRARQTQKGKCSKGKGHDKAHMER